MAEDRKPGHQGDDVVSADSPRLPTASSREASAEELSALRQFHFGAGNPGEGSAVRELRPAWVPGLDQAHERAQTVLWAPSAKEGNGSVCEPLAETVDRLTENDGLGSLPPRARLLPVNAQLPLRLLMHLSADDTATARRRWRRELRPLVDGLRLLLDKTTPRNQPFAQPSTPDQALGQLGERFFDTGALAARLSAGLQDDLEPSRRQRLEETARVLDQALAHRSVTPIVICDPKLPDWLTSVENIFESSVESDVESDAESDVEGDPEARDSEPKWLTEDDPYAAAAEHFDRNAAELGRYLAAVRVARLELQQTYQPEIHDPALAAFDWQSFHREELLLLPPLIVWVEAEQVAREGMASLSRLLLSGRPVQVLVAVDPGSSPGAEEAAPGFRFEPAYVGLSHRGAFVHQGSVAAPTELAEGLRRACQRTGTKLHVVATPPESPGTLSHADLAAAANAARAHPHFIFDPEAADDWAGRFDLTANPDLEADWPRGEIAVLSADEADAEGAVTTLEVAFTFADYMLFVGRGREDFLPIEDELTSEALLPLADWLGLSPEESLHSVPYLWAMASDSRLRRLAVTRRLAISCRDRLDYWHTLQQLGGVHDPYVERARAQDREAADVLVQQERERLVSEHAAALSEQRQQVAVEVVQRLMQGLLGGGQVPESSPASQDPADPPGEVATTATQ